MRESFTAIRWHTIAILLAVVAASTSQAHAQTSHFEDITASLHTVVIDEMGKTYRIRVHPAFVTVLYFPAPVVNVVQSDMRNFVVKAKDARVVLRPSEDAPSGVIANINVLTHTLMVSIVLLVTDQAEDAVPQAIFQVSPPRPPPPSPPPSPPLADRLSLSMGGIIGVAFLGLAPAESRPGASWLMGTEARLVLANGNSHSYEASMAVAQIATEHKSSMPLPPSGGYALVQSTILTRFQLGTSLHWGTRVVPRVHLACGLQAQAPIDRRVDLGRDGRAVVEEHAPWAFDMIVIAGTSIAMTLGRNWKGGMGVSTTRTLHSTGHEFTSIEGTLFVRWL